MIRSPVMLSVEAHSLRNWSADDGVKRRPTFPRNGRPRSSEISAHVCLNYEVRRPDPDFQSG